MSRIHVAFLLYLALALIAALSLRGDFRMAVLVLLGGLAIKTWIGELKRRSTVLSNQEGTMESSHPEHASDPQEK